jgi:ABC-type Fe3+ transport system permease subunit
MEVEINWLGVILATLSTMVVGTVWYTPKVFGDIWMRLAKVDQKKAKQRGARPIIITLVVSFVSAYVLAHVAYMANQFFGNSFLQDALGTAFWTWLGFTAARFITHDAFEGRPIRLSLINIMHELATFMVMGLVIGLLHP